MLLCISVYKFLSDHMFLIFLHVYLYVVRAQLRQSCPTLCHPMDCSPPDSVHGIL